MSDSENHEQQIANLEKKIASLSKESANYRTQRNTALRRSAAYETMLGAHNIKTDDVTEDALEGLLIKNGKVDSEFKYSAPKPESTKTRTSESPNTRVTPEKGTTLTRADIAGMSEEQINKRWDEIAPQLEQGVQ